MSYTDELLDYLTVLSRDKLDELEALEKSIEKLPPREKSLITARHVLGLPFKDIIEHYPTSERNMYNIYRDAICHLDMKPLDDLFLKRYGTITPF